MSRAVSPLLGAVLLAGITVVLAVVVGATALGVVPSIEPSEPIVLSATATADGVIELVHEGGPTLDVDAITLRISIDGTPLDHQPPVPFFSATGFYSGPTGPFNPAAEQTWSLGERASLAVAGTNAPHLTAGATLSVGIYRDDTRIAVVETTIE